MGSRVLERAVAKIDRERERAIERLAAKVRRDILVPACTKHGLDFKSGNGTWVLSAGDSMLFDAEEAARKGFRLKRLFDALETRIGDWPRGSVTPGGPELGMYVEDFSAPPRSSRARQARR